MRVVENDLSFGDSIGLGEPYPVADGGAGALVKVISAPDQKPVQGATVVLYNPNGTAYDSDTTDAAGRAILYGSPPVVGTSLWTAKVVSLPAGYVPTTIPGSVQIPFQYSDSSFRANRASDRVAEGTYKSVGRYYDVGAEVVGYREEYEREKAAREVAAAAAAKAAEEAAARAAHEEMIRQETQMYTPLPPEMPEITPAVKKINTASAGADWKMYVMVGGGAALLIGLVVWLKRK